MAKKQEIIDLLEAAGFVAAEESNAEAKTYSPKSPYVALSAFYKKNVAEAGTDSVADVLNAPENPKPKKAPSQKVDMGKRIEIAGEIVEITAKSNIKHNGELYKEGEKIKLDGDSAVKLYLAGVCEYVNDEDSVKAKEALSELEKKEMEELKKLKEIADEK